MKTLGSQERVSVHFSTLSPNPSLLPKKNQIDSLIKHTQTHKTCNNSYPGEPSVLFESKRIPRVNSIRRRRRDNMKNACVHFCPRDLPFAIVIVELNPTTPHCLSNKKEADHQISSSFKDFLSFFSNMRSYELPYWPGCGHLRLKTVSLLREWKMLLIRMSQDQDNTMIVSVRKIIVYSRLRFLDSDRSLNYKRKKFKVFEIEPRLNRGRTMMML